MDRTGSRIAKKLTEGDSRLVPADLRRKAQTDSVRGPIYYNLAEIAENIITGQCDMSKMAWMVELQMRCLGEEPEICRVVRHGED